MCVAAGAEGLRADLVLARAAAALAGWHGRTEITAADLHAVAPWCWRTVPAASHSIRPAHRLPASTTFWTRCWGGPIRAAPARGAIPTMTPRRNVPTATARAATAREPHCRAPSPNPGPSLGWPRCGRCAEQPGHGPASPAVADRGRIVVPTLRAGRPDRWHRSQPSRPPPSAERPNRGGAAHHAPDLREPRRESRTGNLLVLAVDASGSMGADRRMAAVKGALLGLLVDAYQRRDRVALVTFGGAGAQVVLRPTGSVEIARSRLEDLPTGGETPLAEGITTAVDLAARAANPTSTSSSSSSPTAAPPPVPNPSRRPWRPPRLGPAPLPAVVVRAGGPRNLGLAGRLATAMDARHLPLSDLRADRLEAALRTL